MKITSTVLCVFIFLSGYSQKVVSSHSIYFETGKYRLSAGNKAMMKAVIDSFKNEQSFIIKLLGYTDNVGSYVANKILSKKRAEAVKDLLAAKGVKESALIAEGFGADDPITSNQTAEDRRQNRRVDIKKWAVSG
jgi:OmpA-OmpF porin, OOP family